MEVPLLFDGCESDFGAYHITAISPFVWNRKILPIGSKDGTFWFSGKVSIDRSRS